MRDTNDDRQYILVILKPEAIAYGPFRSRDDAEYTAMDYYRTAITGASVDNKFAIVELVAADPAAIERQHAAHIVGLMASDA